MTLYLIGILFWVVVTSGLVPAHYLFVGFNYLILGVAGGLFSIANTRIAMDTMPEMGRNHFFALFTVFASLSLGLAPIFWGVFLDTLGKKEFSIGFFQVEKKGKPFDTAVRDVVILARLKLYGRFFNR
jgi:MFS family permease